MKKIKFYLLLLICFIFTFAESKAQPCTSLIIGPSHLALNQTAHYSADPGYISWFLLNDPLCSPCPAPYIVINGGNEVDINAGPIPGTFVIMVENGGIFQCYKTVIIDDVPLPVEMSSFVSVVSGSNVLLRWTTASEINNSGFEIQRLRTSGAPDDWTILGFINGIGNSNSQNSYTFEDRNLPSGKYTYKLKQIDFNGNSEYFNLSNEVNVGTPEKFDLSQNYPNPFNPSTKIDFDIPFDSKVTLKIFDMSGKEVAVVVNETKTAGYYSVNYNAAGLTSGVYFYKITAGSFSAIKKMMFIK